MKKLILTLALLTIATTANAYQQTVHTGNYSYQPVQYQQQPQTIEYKQYTYYKPVQPEQTTQHMQPITFYGLRTPIQGATNVVFDVATGIQSVRNMISAFKGGF